MDIDKKDLKIQALSETISVLQNQVADLRVDLTISEIEKTQLAEKVKEFEAPKKEAKDSTTK